MEDPIGTDPSGGVSAAENPEPAAVETAAQETPAGEFAELEAQLAGKPEAGVLERLKELAQKRDEYKSQAEAAAQYEPWAPVLETLQTNLGLNPEQVLQYLQQQQQQATQPLSPPDSAQAEAARQQAFSQFLQAKDITPDQWWDLSPDMQAYWVDRFEMHEEREKQAAAQAAEQERRTQAEQDLEFKSIQADERFKGWVQDPVLSDFIRLGQSYGFDGRQIAEKLHGSLETLVQARLAAYSTGKAQDAQIPVVAGGNSPSPAPRPDLQDRASRLAALDHLANQAPV